MITEQQCSTTSPLLYRSDYRRSLGGGKDNFPQQALHRTVYYA